MKTYTDWNGQELKIEENEISHISHDQVVNSLSETYTGSVSVEHVEREKIPVFETEQPFTEPFLNDGEYYYELNSHI